MSDGADLPAEADPRTGYGEAAFRGSLWTGLQVAVNKVAAAGATVVLGFLLTAEDFGVAWFAISAGQVALLFPVVAIVDVLIAAPRRYVELAPSARRLAVAAAVTQAVLIAVVGIALSWIYPDRHGLAGLMAMVALRPLADAVMVVPLSGLRINLQFKAISAIDCAVSLVSSALSVAFAAAGLGPSAIVLPPIMAIGFRGLMYRRAVGARRIDWSTGEHARINLRQCSLAALGWYLAGLLYMIEFVVLGTMASTRSLGMFAFAFGLASQLNGVVSFQVASAIQPIISRLADSPLRQADGALRAIRMIQVVVVPLLMVQAAVGGSVIRQMWPDKWDDAVPVFQVMCIAQALYASQWPAAFVLKAQGRFMAYLKVQGANIIAAAAMLPIAVGLAPRALPEWADLLGVPLAKDALQPIGVALGTLAIIVVFSPVMLLTACPSLGLRKVLDAVWRPVVVTAPLALLSFVGAMHIERSEMPRWAILASEAAVASLAALMGVALAASAWSSTRADAVAGLSRLVGRAPRGS